MSTPFGAAGVLRCSPTARPATILTWLNALLVEVGTIALHASAFTRDGVGVAIVGRAHSGKTGALLAARMQGWAPLGDECIWLTGGVAHPVTVPMEIHHRYLCELPEYRRQLATWKVWRAGTAARLADWLRPASVVWSRRFDARAKVVTTGAELFGGFGPARGIDHLIISTCIDNQRIDIEEIGREEARRELLDIQMAELQPVLDALEHSDNEAHVRDRLTAKLAAEIDDVLGGVHVHRLVHPYPVSAHDLATAITSHL